MKTLINIKGVSLRKLQKLPFKNSETSQSLFSKSETSNANDIPPPSTQPSLNT